MSGRIVEIPDVELGPELGQGAHSRVHRALRRGEPCAVKLPRSRGRWTTSVYREAVALARVHHPLLPDVLEVGEVEGLPYLIMELVEGETLSERLRRGPVPERETLELGLGIANALGAVHAAGLVHRDVKPRNLVLDRRGKARLVDFGFASPIERGGEVGAAGTLGYAAPEQLHAPALVDGRADLYAVGRVLFECLAGRLPDPTNAAGRGPAIELVELGVRPGFAKIVDALLSRDPAERYPSARTLEVDLQAVRNGRPVSGPPAADPLASRPAMVGRDHLVSRLTKRLSRVGEAGGALVLLEGVAGSGKTRLLQELVATHPERETKVVEVCAEPGDAPLAVLRRLLEAYLATSRAAGDAPGARAEAALRAAGAGSLGRALPLIAPSLCDRAPPAGRPPMTGTEELVESASELIVRWVSRQGPRLIVVDDLQWADAVSRDVLLRVAHRVHEAPLVLVLAARPEGFSDAAARALYETHPDRLECASLGALERSDVALLIAKQLGGSAMDPGVVRRIEALTDGTPLGVLEVLSAYLDGGALRPHDGTWHFDPSRAERVALPEGAQAMLGHRAADLPAATRRVLQLAAMLGTTFGDDLLARVVGIGLDDLQYGLAEARRTGLLEPARPGAHRFVHDTLRESISASMAPAERRAAHQHVAEVLDESADAPWETVFAKARHYAQGEVDRTPGPAGRAARAAAEASLDRSDNEAALRFLELARAAAELGGPALDVGFHRCVGEAQLRRGNLEESLGAFGAALDLASDDRTRGELLGRIAWVHQTAADPELAWAALERAFRCSGAPMPAENVASAGYTLARGLRRGVRALRRQARPEAANDELALRCQLLYQSARLGLEYGKPLRMLQSTLQTLEESDRLGESSALARARAMYGVVLTAMGRKDAGTRALEDAVRIAQREEDSVTTAFAASLRGLGACFAGDFDRAQAVYRECFDLYGPWMELSELCLSVGNAELVDALRGRPDAAWRWIELANARVRRSHGMTVAYDDFLVPRAVAALSALGRDLRSEPWLSARHEARQRQAAPLSDYHCMLSWGPRIRCYVESGDLGAGFDALVEAFEAERFNPRTAHPFVTEYYIALAHARLHQCLRASEGDRANHVAALRKALSDLRASARLPLFKAHSLYIQACLRWLEGSATEARKQLFDVERLAEEQTCPWVLYGVARVRAHMLLAEGRLEAAKDQARIAESLATAHGAEPRAQWIRDEIGLEAPRAPAVQHSMASSRGSSSRTSHQLDAVLHVVRAGGRDLHPDRTAASVLDQLVREVDADRGVVLFHPEVDARPRVLLGRVARGGSSFAVDEQSQGLLRSVRDQSESWASSAAVLSVVGSGQVVDVERVLGEPLFLHDRAVGSVVLEREPSKPPFSAEDRGLLHLLAQQVPLALELPRLLAEREQLQASLQHAQKMDAVGQLAGGVAHDFNNMLTVVRTSVERLQQLIDDPGEVSSELEVISDATARAAELTRQLLTFSRHRPVSDGACDVNAVLTEIEPMLRRLVGRSVELSMRLAPRLARVDADRAALEQAIVNLAGNARDAMPGGGTLEIVTEDVWLDDDAIPHRAGSEGQYLSIVVRDDGVGMSPELRERVFEPFFTTKAPGKGTGLGLATVYSFAHNAGGHVAISSEVGRGSEVRIYLPRERAQAPASDESPKPPTSSGGPPTDSATILVVDDEAAIARSIRRTLAMEGYRVLVADDANRALEILRERGVEISLVILDVLMPDMHGPMLAERIAELALPARLLFMSGYAPKALDARELSIDPHAFMEKPFTQSDLIGKVQSLLDS